MRYASLALLAVLASFPSVPTSARPLEPFDEAEASGCGQWSFAVSGEDTDALGPTVSVMDTACTADSATYAASSPVVRMRHTIRTSALTILLLMATSPSRRLRAPEVVQAAVAPVALPAEEATMNTRTRGLVS